MTARMNHFATAHQMFTAAHCVEAPSCCASQMNTVKAILGIILLVSIFVALTQSIRIMGVMIISLISLFALVGLIDLSCHLVLKEPTPAL